MAPFLIKNRSKTEQNEPRNHPGAPPRPPKDPPGAPQEPYKAPVGRPGDRRGTYGSLWCPQGVVKMVPQAPLGTQNGTLLVIRALKKREEKHQMLGCLQRCPRPPPSIVLSSKSVPFLIWISRRGVFPLRYIYIYIYIYILL